MLCAAAWICVIGIFCMAPRGRHPAYDIQVDAAERMKACIEEMAKVRAPLDAKLDLNRTGFIGVDFSGMTTTLGSLESKRTAASPDAAAMVVRLLDGLNLPQGAAVAVNMSGSFPGLNTAVICAVEAMGLKALPIVSLGASTYGANTMEWTALDIHEHLRQAGLIDAKLLAASVGGGRDIGKGMPEEDAPEALKQKIIKSGVLLIEEQEYEKNVDMRMALYGDAAAYINVGGNWVGGIRVGAENLPVGVILPGEIETENADGLLVRWLKKGVPTVHLLNMKALCVQTGLPYDPSPFESSGESSVYAVCEPNRMPALGGFILLGGLGGGVLFFSLLSRPLRPVWDFWLDRWMELFQFLSLPGRFCAAVCKKFAFQAKTLFYFLRKYATIHIEGVWKPLRKGGMSHGKARQTRKKEKIR